MENHVRLLCIILLVSGISSCISGNNSDVLQTWSGKYSYEEPPIKAIAGYNMLMLWELNILKATDKYIGYVEINGQQTNLKLESEVVGDEKSVSLLYLNTLEGFSENLKPGDTLFTIRKNDKGLITQWASLVPRLSDNPTRECNCFTP